MCGIIGVVGRNIGLSEAELVRRRDLMGHRGPDDAGVWIDGAGGAALGHRRLSIIDLSAAGRQPMKSRDGRFHLVFNGEIYNFRELRDRLRGLGHCFDTGTDSEVILAAFAEWGEDCVSELAGMFALGVYDADRRKLFLARDRAGEKPLFVAHRPGSVSFASELKAILADPRQPRSIDLEALDHYLAFGYVPGSHCLIAGVRKLPPGHALSYDLDRDEVRSWAYWTLPTPYEGGPASVEALSRELEGLLVDSIQRQLVADVPVGILLSGGLDSSIVTALASQGGRRVRTFTISFPGHVGFDEGPHARVVADHFGTEHLELVAEPATIDLLPSLARQYDEPIADSSMIPTYLLSRLVREHCTVALGGDGGDELFGGYHLYNVAQAQQRVRSLMPEVVSRIVAGGAALLPVGLRGRAYLMNLRFSPVDAVARTGIYLDRATRQRLVPALRDWRGPRAEEFRASKAAAGRTMLQRLTIADFHSYLPDDVLVKVDRASMLASLEVRAPFLDHRVVEFAFHRVPDRMRATATERKVLLRHLAGRLLPKSLDLTRKRGFSIPLAAWFKGEWAARLSQILTEPLPGVLDRTVVQKLLALQRTGFSNSRRIYSLVMLELWRREYGIGGIG